MRSRDTRSVQTATSRPVLSTFVRCMCTGDDVNIVSGMFTYISVKRRRVLSESWVSPRSFKTLHTTTGVRIVLYNVCATDSIDRKWKRVTSVSRAYHRCRATAMTSWRPYSLRYVTLICRHGMDCFWKTERERERTRERVSWSYWSCWRMTEPVCVGDD